MIVISISLKFSMCPSVDKAFFLINLSSHVNFTTFLRERFIMPDVQVGELRFREVGLFAQSD